MKIRRVFDNIEIKLICLLLAAVMWLYANKSTELVSKALSAISRSEQGRIMFRDVPIELVGLQGGVRWTVNPSKVSLEVMCPVAAEIDAVDFRALVKITQSDKGKFKIPLNADNVVLPRGLVFVSAEPDEIQVSLKQKVG